MKSTDVVGCAAPAKARVPAALVVFTDAREATTLCRDAAACGIVVSDFAKSTGVTKKMCTSAVRGALNATTPDVENGNASSQWRIAPVLSTDAAGRPDALCAVRQLRRELMQHTSFLSPKPSSLTPVRNGTRNTDATNAGTSPTPLSESKRFLFRARCPIETTRTEDSTGHSVVFLWANTTVSDNKEYSFFSLENESSATPFLCVDVGGLYTAATVSQSPPLQQKRRSTKQSLHSPNLQRPDAEEYVDGREESATRALPLVALLQQRFSVALKTMPLDWNTEAEVTLIEVWVVPVRATKTLQGSVNSHLPLNYFPSFVVKREDVCANSISPLLSVRTSSQKPLQTCVRIAQLPPNLELHIPQMQPREHFNAEKRKRLRSEEDGTLARHPPTNNISENVHDVFSKRHFTGNVPLRLRVIERSFLDHSCYFSYWCCANDFEVTESYVGDILKNSVPAAEIAANTTSPLRRSLSSRDAYHAFYAALQRSVETEERSLYETWEALWCAGDNPTTVDGIHTCAVELSASALSEAFANRCKNQFGSLVDPDDTAQATPTNDLFSDSTVALMTPTGADILNDRSKRTAKQLAWSVSVLWGLWTRLGWTPPSPYQSSTFSVQLQNVTTASSIAPVIAGCSHSASPRFLTSAEWTAFIRRCNEALDDKYVQEKFADLKEEGNEQNVVEGKNNEGHDTNEAGDRPDCASGGSLESVLLDYPSQQLASMKWESLDALHRAFSIKFALLSSKVPSDYILQQRELHSGNIDKWHGRNFRVSEKASEQTDVFDNNQNIDPHLYVSPAAQALAADIAATTPNSSACPCSANGKGVASPAAFSELWAYGVLESPALLFSSSPAVAAVSSLTAATPPPFTLRDGSAGDSVSAINQLLRGPRVCTLSSQEWFCEVADIAELHWRANTRVPYTSSSHSTLNCITESDVQESQQRRCRCCCAVACEAAAKALAQQCQFSPGRYTSANTEGKFVDPIAQLLHSSFAEFLKRNEVEASLSTPLASNATATDTNAQLTPFCEKENEEEQSTTGHDHNTPEVAHWMPTFPAGKELTVVLTNTIVRAVQQNKAVVRRLMQLVESYESIVSAAKTEGRKSYKLENIRDKEQDAAGAAATKEPKAEMSKETLAGNVWRCLSGADLDSAAEKQNDSAMAAKNLAIRQLQSFWTNVAAVTRQSVLRQYIEPVDFGNNVDPETASVVEERALRGCSSVVDSTFSVAAQEDESSRVHRANLTIGETSSTINDTVTEHNKAAQTNVLASTTSIPPLQQYPSGKAISTTYAAAAATDHQLDALTAFEKAINELDGARAMQLYMRHILLCVADKSGASLPPHCTSLSDALFSESQSIATPLTRCKKDTRQQSTVCTFSELLRPHLWVQHALFILSYGLAGLSEMGSAAVQQTTKSLASAACDETKVRSDAEVEVPSFVSPHLSTFRVLRNGKLTLDSWILAAMEEYADRWHRAVQRRVGAPTW